MWGKGLILWVKRLICGIMGLYEGYVRGLYVG